MIVKDVKIGGVYSPETACRIEFPQKGPVVFIRESMVVVTGVCRARAERNAGTPMSPIDQSVCQTMYLTGYPVRLVRRQFFVEEGNPDNRLSRLCAILEIHNGSGYCHRSMPRIKQKAPSKMKETLVSTAVDW